MDLSVDVPENMSQLLDDVPMYPYQDEDETTQRVFKLAEAGKCMCCEQPVGERTIAVVGPPGLIMLFCSTVCLTDLMNLQMIGELHMDLQDRIDFRKNGEQ